MFSLHDVSDPKLVNQNLFALAVLAVAVLPRMPFDSTFSIGGNLSRGFRKFLLFVVLFRLGRIGLLSIEHEALYLTFGAFEGIFLCFLSLLTPYLLRLWLSDRVTIPGSDKPGLGLQPWFLLFCVLSAMGVIVRSVTGQKHWWLFKKLADVLGFFPVYQTLQIYNRVTTADVPHPGRGTVLSQIVVVGEFYCLLTHSVDLTFKILEMLSVVDEHVFERMLWVRGIYWNHHYAYYTRSMLHSILLNVLDEMHDMHRPIDDGTASRRTSEHDNGRDEETESFLSQSSMEENSRSLVRGCPF